MSKYGIKIAKPGKSINSTNIDDYVFWSKHPALSIVDRKTTSIVVDSSNYGNNLETEVEHDLGFIPLVIGHVTSSADGNRVMIPTLNHASYACTAGLLPSNRFEIDIYIDKVVVAWSVACSLFATVEPPTNPITFSIELDFYMWQLGRQFNP
jgi:hypothetical protein